MLCNLLSNGDFFSSSTMMPELTPLLRMSPPPMMSLPLFPKDVAGLGKPLNLKSEACKGQERGQ
jgi:hypothetical protein